MSVDEDKLTAEINRLADEAEATQETPDLLAMANILFDRFQDPGVNEIKDRIKHVFRERHLFWMGDT